MTVKAKVARRDEPAHELTNIEKISSLPWNYAFNVANMVFVQLTYFGSVFVLFLNELKLNKTQIGFLLAIITFFDILALFVAPTVARLGYKRAFTAFFGLRTVFTCLLLLTPWVFNHYGSRAVLIFVAGIIAAFSITRSIGLTALTPWSQERVPDAIRGKYLATNNIFTSIAQLVAITIAGRIVGGSIGLERFMLIFAIGIAAGFLSIWFSSNIAGGAPQREINQQKVPLARLKAPLHDSNFTRYLLGSGLIMLATGPVTSFLPLFMHDRVGLSQENVVLLQTGRLIGSLLSGYVWGWAADRYGSRPVVISGVYLIAAVPVLYALVPRHSALSFPVAITISFLDGVANTGWMIGASRLLFVSIVPSAMRSDYMALYNAWDGVTAGFSQLIGGRILDFFANLQGQFLIFTVDSYAILFLIGLVLPAGSLLLLRTIRADSKVSMSEFAGLFIHGNPLKAAETLIRFQLAKEEQAVIQVIERLGLTKSLLTVEELLEALSDPRFYVRFEALVSIARHRPDERLINALIKVLEGNDPALSVIAAWALGRTGSQLALEPLRRALNSPYRSVQAHAARSLGTLGDEEVIPILQQRLARESDRGLQSAYAAALGKLRVRESTATILNLLQDEQDAERRMELALALARIVDDENEFIQLLRGMRSDPGTTAAQALTNLRRKLGQVVAENDEMKTQLEQCILDFSRQDLNSGCIRLAEIILHLPLEQMDQAEAQILRNCAAGIKHYATDRIDCLILALHILNMSICV